MHTILLSWIFPSVKGKKMNSIEEIKKLVSIHFFWAMDCHFHSALWNKGQLHLYTIWTVWIFLEEEGLASKLCSLVYFYHPVSVLSEFFYKRSPYKDTVSFY